MKVCGPCGRDLPVTCFYRRAASPDGLSPVCKDCVRVKVRARKDRLRAGDEGPYERHRFPMEPLLRAAGIRLESRRNTESSKDDAAAMLGISRSAFENWQDRGMRWPQADRAACAAGLHPFDVWADWYTPGV